MKYNHTVFVIACSANYHCRAVRLTLDVSMILHVVNTPFFITEHCLVTLMCIVLPRALPQYSFEPVSINDLFI